jgi:hypothetical protein
MSILGDLNQPPTKIWPCRVRTLYNEFEKKDQAIFEAAIQDLNWKASTLSKALAVKGVIIAGSAITRHRQKECSCSKI